MEDQMPRNPWPGSLWLGVLLGLVAVLPTTFPELGLGLRWPYLAVVVGLSVWMWSAHSSEEKRRGWEDGQRKAEWEERDETATRRHTQALDEAEQRHHAALSKQQEQFEQIMASQAETMRYLQEEPRARAAVERSGSVGTPLLKAIDDSHTVVNAVIFPPQAPVAGKVLLRGYTGWTQQLSSATLLLRGISENPPTTVASVKAAADQLTNYITQEKLADFVELSDGLGATTRDEHGNVMDKR
jgi:hypothetical protein